MSNILGLEAISLESTPVIHAFTASTRWVDWGEEVELRWETEGADYYYIPRLEKALDASGSVTVTAEEPNGVLEYTLVCGKGSSDDRGDDVERDVRVMINDLEVLRFDASREEIVQGDAATISWKAKSARQCMIMIDGEVIARGVCGSHTMTLHETTTFTLVADGVGEVVRLLTVYVTPVGTTVKSGVGLLGHTMLGDAAETGLSYKLINAINRPEVYIGADQKANNKLTLEITNVSGERLTLRGGAPVEQKSIGTTPAAFYITAGAVMDGKQYETVKIAAKESPEKWEAKYYGGTFKSWGIFPKSDYIWEPNGKLIFTIGDVVVTGSPRPGALTVDRRNIGTLAKDSRQVELFVQDPPREDKELNLEVMVSGGDIEITTSRDPVALANRLRLSISNPSPLGPIVPPEKQGQGSPSFNLSFVYGVDPGYWALTTIAEAANIGVGPDAVPAPGWDITPHLQAEVPYWELKPKSPAVLGVRNEATAIFAIQNIISRLAPGVTLLYLQYSGIPGYRSGYKAVQIEKKRPAPRVMDFGLKVGKGMDIGEKFTLVWKTKGGDYCLIEQLHKEVELNGSIELTAPSTPQSYTLVCGRGTPERSTDQHSLTVNVAINAPTIEVFTASPSPVKKGGEVTITWKVRSAVSCDLKIGGTVVASGGPSGTYKTRLQGDTTFTLVATGNGSVTRPLTVGLGRVRIIDFYLSPFGTMVWDTKYIWKAEYADYVEITAGSYIGYKTIMAHNSPPDEIVASGELTPPFDALDSFRMMARGVSGTVYSGFRGTYRNGAAHRLESGKALAAAGDIGLTVANAEGNPVVYLGSEQKNTLTLTLANTSASGIALSSGAPVAESAIGATPSALYLTMGGVLDKTELAALKITASGWTAHYFDGAFPSWGLFPDAAATLAAGDVLTITIGNIVAVGQPRPGHLTVDYCNLGSVANDSVQLPIIVHNPPSGPAALELTAAFTGGSAGAGTVYITPSGEASLANHLDLSLINPSPVSPIVPDDVPWGANPPVFYLFFVYGGQPGYSALCTADQGAAITVGAEQQGPDVWAAASFTQGPLPYWELSPRNQEILGVGQAGVAVFSVDNIITSFQPGLTLAYLMWGNIPGYNDGYTALPITKMVEPPTIEKFEADEGKVDWGEKIKLTWTTSGGTFCYIKELGGTEAASGSTTVTADSTTVAVKDGTGTVNMTLICGTGTPSSPVTETSRPLQVGVNDPSIESFAVSASDIAQGDSITITWQASSVSSCTLKQNGAAVASGASGSHTVALQDTATFQLVCEGTKEVTQDMTVTVHDVAIAGFSAGWSADPNGIPLFGTSAVSWQVEYASSVVVTRNGGVIYSNGSPGMPTDSGSQSFYGKGTYGDSFQITCNGKGGPVSQGAGA